MRLDVKLSNGVYANIKEKIRNELFDRNVDSDILLKHIKDYKKQYPYDVDMYLLEGYFYLKQKDIFRAENILLLSLKYNSYNIDTYFLLGEVYALEKEYCKAIGYYSYAGYMDEYISQEHFFFNVKLCDSRLKEAVHLIDDILISGDEQQIRRLGNEFKILNNQIKYKLDIFGSIIANNYSYIGESLFIQDDGKRFCAYANASGFCNHSPVIYNLIDFKAELLKIQSEGNHYSVISDEKILLPIASKEPLNMISFRFDSDKKITVRQSEKNAFNYFKITENAEITSDQDMIIGKPVILKHLSSHKKLIISFFVDGLSQQLLSEAGLENVMPNTFRFFSKGLICSNFFATSDWTYPSLASFVSGVTLPEHMMFHPIVNKKLPDNKKIIFEYLKDAGYYTARFNGDWRSCATYGYSRGIDRYVAQQGYYYRGCDPIIDTIEHIETFKETDQYVWVEYNDLHDIADEIDPPLLMQGHLDLALREAEKKSITSVKQDSSLLKHKLYINALKTADFRFQILFDYLERSFHDDEYIVTMFGDHGQTYLLKPGQHHLSRYHSNVAFMVRGGGYQGVCEEYMSGVDYPNILCKLANVKEEIIDTEGNLPRIFGGKEERPFTITETIHPNDPYEVAIHAKDHIFYLTTEKKVTDSGRLDTGEYRVKLCDPSGKEMNNLELVDFYVKLTGQRLKYILNY